MPVREIRHPSAAELDLPTILRATGDPVRLALVRILSDDRERTFRGPKPAGRFDSGRRRGFDDREEFRAREEFRSEDLRVDAEE